MTRSFFAVAIGVAVLMIWAFTAQFLDRPVAVSMASATGGIATFLFGAASFIAFQQAPRLRGMGQIVAVLWALFAGMLFIMIASLMVVFFLYWVPYLA